MLIIKTSSEEETFSFGEHMAKSLRAGDVICLQGDLGAGKTLLVKGIAEGLGVQEAVTSPTFVIMNVYEATIPIHHFDLYRLEDSSELWNIGFEEYASNSAPGIALIEWPDKFVNDLPVGYLWINITLGEHLAERVLTIQAKGIRHQILYEELSNIADSCFRHG